jgi:glycosyltransferase involved in cell wall biosynthesis
VVYSGLDERFRPLRETAEHTDWEKAFREKYKLGQDIIVLHVGRYYPRKNFEGLLKSFAALKVKWDEQEDRPERAVRLLQVGGQFSPEHPALIARSGIEASTTQIPFVSEEDLPHVYSLA